MRHRLGCIQGATVVSSFLHGSIDVVSREPSFEWRIAEAVLFVAVSCVIVDGAHNAEMPSAVRSSSRGSDSIASCWLVRVGGLIDSTSRFLEEGFSYLSNRRRAFASR